MSEEKIDALAVMYDDAADAAQYRGLYARDVKPPAEFLRKSDAARGAVRELIAALEMATRQNSHDMLMTGDELRQCEAALARVRSS